MDAHITKRTAVLLLLDIVATYAAYWLASLLTAVEDEVFVNNEIYFILGILAFFNVAVLGVMRLYNNLWEYASVDEAIQIMLAVVLSTLIGAVFLWIIDVRLPIRVFFVSCFLLIFFMGGIRLVFRVMRQKKRVLGSAQRACDRPRTLIVGAGETGSLAIGRMASKDPLMPGIPIVATDDDASKRGSRIHGVKVAGTTDDIVELVDRYDIEQIVVAIPSASLEERKRIYGECTKTECKLRTLPNIRELSLDEIGDVRLRDVDVADLLGREEIILNTRAVSGYIAGECVLVTGGGGSIGSELCRQIMRYQPRRLLIFDIYENCAYELETELKNKYGPEAPVITLIGSIRDKARLDEVFDTYHPSVVFHAAAHKHVPLMEISPAEAVKNNVFGTKNLLTSAAEHGVERFVQLSTDKAVNPTNVMGCTKRLCEMLIQTFSRGTDMTCVAVRFGNVLGSHGSVIPLFEEQIKRGGPVTITHPDIVRYFMTITEAAQLVLQAGGLAKGGSIYVLDMGEPVKIMDLANRLIRFYGYEPGVNMQVKITGLRPGEKLYEELLMDTEQDKMAKTAHNKIFIAPPMQIDLEKFYTDLQTLKTAARHNDNDVVDILQEMVPTYHPNRRVRADHTVVAATGNTAIFSKEEVNRKLQGDKPAAKED